jgi:hypothetical protein
MNEAQEKLNEELARIEARNREDLIQKIIDLTPGGDLPNCKYATVVDTMLDIQQSLDLMLRLADCGCTKQSELFETVKSAVDASLQMKKLVHDIAMAMNHDGMLFDKMSDVDGTFQFIHKLREELFCTPNGKYALPQVGKLPDPDVGSVWRFTDDDSVKHDYKVVSKNSTTVTVERVGSYGTKYYIPLPYFLSAKLIFE